MMAVQGTSNPKKRESDIGLTAAAFQDHLIKSCNLNDGLKPPKKSHCHKMYVSHKGIKVDPSSSKCIRKREYVLDESKKKQHLSLAEKLGIIDTPVSHKLSEKQWQELKETSEGRNELSEPCSICKEFYTHTKQQVLLSCSHVFHRKCIASFEQYSGHKTCPICRFKNYEKRVIFDGAVITSHKCATKIQSQWRRYVEQKKYKLIRQTIPPKDKNLRKEFYKNKFLDICDKVAKSYDDHQQDISQLIYSIDQNIASNRSVMKKFNNSLMNELDWESVQNDATRRDFQECPICLSLFKQSRKQKVLLSCSHLFHVQCLSAYEHFSDSRNPLCPVCRTVYSKNHVTTNDSMIS